jgi:hypothetical protein
MQCIGDDAKVLDKPVIGLHPFSVAGVVLDAQQLGRMDGDKYGAAAAERISPRTLARVTVLPSARHAPPYAKGNDEIRPYQGAPDRAANLDNAERVPGKLTWDLRRPRNRQGTGWGCFLFLSRQRAAKLPAGTAIEECKRQRRRLKDELRPSAVPDDRREDRPEWKVPRFENGLSIRGAASTSTSSIGMKVPSW